MKSLALGLGVLVALFAYLFVVLPTVELLMVAAVALAVGVISVMLALGAILWATGDRRPPWA